MADKPLVTVAVPSFNQGRYLETALASLFAQGLPLEVFVADAGSTPTIRWLCDPTLGGQAPGLAQQGG